MPVKLVHLALVDDHVLLRKTLKNYLSQQSGINVVIQASNLSDLLEKLNGTNIDVVVLDLFMPGLNGNDAVMKLRIEHPAIKILVLSMCTDMNLISELLESGIHGYLSKSDEPEELLKAIYAAAENRIFRNKEFTEALYWNKQNNAGRYWGRPDLVLNDREKRILQLIWEEKSNKEIADMLFVGVRSIEKIRQELKDKIGVKSTIGLLKYAIHKRIIEQYSLPMPEQTGPVGAARRRL